MPKQPKKPKKPQTRTVDIVHPSYQPNREQLREDLRVDATFEKLAKSVVQPVKVRYVKPKKRED